NEELNSLPITATNGRGRMVQAIFRTLPGITYRRAAYSEDLLVGYDNSLNGSNTMAETYEIDGTSAATQFASKPEEQAGLNPEAVAELRVETNPNAQYGANLGNVVSLVTKSGTNQLHGSYYWYYTSDHFNSANWFANANPGIPQKHKRDRQHQDEFGGSVGG